MEKPQDGQERAARQPARQQRPDDARRFAVSVGLPGVHRRQAHLRAVADQQQHKGRVKPGQRQLMRMLDQLVEHQRRFRADLDHGISQHERAQKRQRDPDRADHEVLPSSFQRSRVVIEVDAGGGRERGGLHGDPHQSQVMRHHHQRHHAQPQQHARAERSIIAVRPQPQVGGRVDRTNEEQHADETDEQAAERIDRQPTVERPLIALPQQPGGQR